MVPTTWDDTKVPWASFGNYKAIVGKNGNKKHRDVVNGEDLNNVISLLYDYLSGRNPPEMLTQQACGKWLF